uniref:NDUFA4 mitochondrial complex associated like 2a n=1 Tax=Pygocentrus nattereri TaxID=42514 RepID=A0AAR2L6A7_PYGNA
MALFQFKFGVRVAVLKVRYFNAISSESRTTYDPLRSLIPQFFFICLGMGGATMYLIRLARGPHVTWNKTSNPEPWNQLSPTYQYKVCSNENKQKGKSFQYWCSQLY